MIYLNLPGGRIIIYNGTECCERPKTIELYCSETVIIHHLTNTIGPIHGEGILENTLKRIWLNFQNT